MMKLRIPVVLLSLLLTKCFGFKTATEDTSECSKYCAKTYPAHTFEKFGFVGSCQRGCRMFQVILFATRKDKAEAQRACSQACQEAYSTDTEKKNACQDGCKHQVPFNVDGSNHFEVVITDKHDPMYRYVHSMMDQMWDYMDHFHERMSDGFNLMRNWFGVDDDPFASLKEMEKEVESILDHHKPFLSGPIGPWKQLELSSTNDVVIPKKFRENILNSFFGRRPVSDPSEQFKGKSVGNMKPDGTGEIIRVEILPLDASTNDGILEVKQTGTFRDLFAEDPHDPKPPVVSLVNDPADSWMAYLAHRTGRLSSATRWLLFLAMSLCVISMVWICLAIMKTAAPQITSAVLYDTNKFPVVEEETGGNDHKDPIEVTYLTGSSDGEKAKLAAAYDIPPVHQCPPPPYSAKE